MLDQRLAVQGRLQCSQHPNSDRIHTHRYPGWRLVYLTCRIASFSSICTHKLFHRTLVNLVYSLRLYCRRYKYNYLDQMSGKRDQCKIHAPCGRCRNTYCYQKEEKLDLYNSVGFFDTNICMLFHQSLGISHQYNWILQLMSCRNSMSKYCYWNSVY